MHSYHVIGIVNLTPNSFVLRGKDPTSNQRIDEAVQMVSEGAYGLDFGAVATHPGAAPVDEQEEWRRLSAVLPVARRLLPNTPFSVDTYRASIAQRVMGEFGVEVINDISGGQWDESMFEVVAKHKAAYVLGHTQGSPAAPTSGGEYKELMSDLIDYFVHKLDSLHRLGVSRVMIDPGFGFSKSVEQNRYLLERLDYLQCLDAPIMVGLSRKRMIYEPLGVEPTSDEALRGSLDAARVAIAKGATYLRVHDVKPTVALC